MSRPVTLDLDAPMRGLVDASDVAIAELARRLGVAPATVSGHVAAGDRVQVSTLRRAAEAVRYDVEIRVRPKE